MNNNVGNVTDSYKNIWNNCEISVSDEKRQILEWLSPMAPRERHQAVREGRVDGVGNRFLRTSDFQKWHTSASEAVNPVLFYYGDPGVGKTYLSSLVIDTLCDGLGGSNMAVACIYCDYNDHKEQSVTSLLAAVLKQIVAGVKTIPEEILAAFDRAKREVDGRALRLPEICTMLVNSVSSLLRGFICLDALDEFPTKHRPKLWDSLQHIIRECPNIRLFITGRPHIREEVRKHFPGYPDQPPIKPTEEDIREYLIMRLKNDSELDAMDARLEADILRIIPEKISGAFLLISLIMDSVLADATIRQRRQTLHNMTNGFGLDDAYSTTLDRIREQKGNRMKLGMEVLMWTSRSERLLKAGELCHALGVELRTTDLDADNVPSIRTLLSCTLGLITIDDQASTVRLVHFTLQEYLVARPHLFITPHSIMAEICLTYLNFQSVCEISTALGEIPSAMPFLHYASCSWGFHARKEMGEDVEWLALQLLQRDANHIWADILLREKSVDFLSDIDHLLGRSPDLRGFTALHGATYMGVTQIAIAMVGMRRWDLNGRDSKGQTPLIWAAKHGHSTLARLLLEQTEVDPNLSDTLNYTPLMHAARAGHEALVELLLEHRSVNPNSLDRNRATPLDHAAYFGHEGIVKLLLGHGNVNPDPSNEDGYTPLMSAAIEGHECIVKLLLLRGDVNPNSSGSDGMTALLCAVCEKHENSAKLLLERGDVDPDPSCDHGRTPLSWAADWGHEGIVRLLLQRGDVDPNSRDQDGKTPLVYAAGSGNEDIVKLLSEQVCLDTNLPDGNGMEALLCAAKFGRLNVVKLLLEMLNVDLVGGGQEVLACAAQSRCEDMVELFLERGYLDPNWSDEIGRTQLSYAAQGGCEGLLKLLLERGDVDPDLADENGQTPISHAAGREHSRDGSPAAVKLLLQREDVNPNRPDHAGNTPLYYAVRSNSNDVVRLLLARGDVDPNPPGQYGRTALLYAVKAQYTDTMLLKLLLEREDTNPNSRDQDGRTPLSLAAERGNERIVRLLLEHGDINPNSRDQDGRTPLSLAAGRGNERIVKLLLERGDVNPNSADCGGLTPLAYATKSDYFGTVRLLSKPRHPNHETPENSRVEHQTSAPALITEEETGSALISQRESVILDPGGEITEVIPLIHCDEPPSNQFEIRPLSAGLPPTPISDPSTKSTTLNPSRPLKRRRAVQPVLRRSKRKRLLSS